MIYVNRVPIGVFALVEGAFETVTDYDEQGDPIWGPPRFGWANKRATPTFSDFGFSRRGLLKQRSPGSTAEDMKRIFADFGETKRSLTEQVVQQLERVFSPEGYIYALIYYHEPWFDLDQVTFTCGTLRTKVPDLFSMWEQVEDIGEWIRGKLV